MPAACTGLLQAPRVPLRCSGKHACNILQTLREVRWYEARHRASLEKTRVALAGVLANAENAAVFTRFPEDCLTRRLLCGLPIHGWRLVRRAASPAEC